MNWFVKERLATAIVTAVVLVAGGIARAWRESHRGRNQERFLRVVRRIVPFFKQRFPDARIVDEMYDLQTKRWAEIVVQCEDVFSRFSMDALDYAYMVAPSAQGPWIDLERVIAARVGALRVADDARSSEALTFLATVHVEHWYLVRSFLHDPGLSERLRELGGRP